MIWAIVNSPVCTMLATIAASAWARVKASTMCWQAPAPPEATVGMLVLVAI